MDDVARLVCSECELIYRVRNLKPGKSYNCKKCGALLRGMNPDGGTYPLPVGEKIGNAIPVHDDPNSDNSDAHINDFESGITNESMVSKSLFSTVCGSERRTGGEFARRQTEMFSRLETQVLRLSGLIDSLSERVEDELPDPGSADRQADAEKLREDLHDILDEVEGKLSELGKKFDEDIASFLAERVKDAGDVLLSRLDEQHAVIQEHSRELAKGCAEGGRTLEIDIQDLADRLIEGIGSSAIPLSPGGGTSVDAIAGITANLVQEQKVHTANLEALTSETKNAIAALVKLDKWRGDLPIQIADEISRTVEDRVVLPISGALARQAPAIFSDLQDNKLVDIVSRSVREAQRPLLREIISGGRGRVPLWLFASILLPLLLILGYLFLPGKFGFGDESSAVALEAVSENLLRLENSGVLLTDDTDNRLRNIEDVVLDIHAQAMTHAHNAAALDEEVKSLKATAAERDSLLKDYGETLQKQTKRLRAYEMTLTRLGVSPEAIEMER